MRIRRSLARSRAISVGIAVTAAILWLGACKKSAEETQPAPAPGMVPPGMEPAPGMKTPTGKMTPLPTQATPKPPEAPAMTPAMTPASTPATMGDSSQNSNTNANAVDVTLTEFTIDMPKTLPPGPTTFRIRNTGTFQHNMEIAGQGIDRKLSTNLNAGEQGRLEVDLKPGDYHVYCPVGKHEERGMTLQLEVAAK